MKNLILIISLLFTLSSCGELQPPDADQKQSEDTERLMNEAERQVGAPNIVNFQERKLAKLILEMRDIADLVSYTYITNMQGELVFIGESVGYGLPYSIQFTNPVKEYEPSGYDGRAATFVPQPDPNLLFMPEGLSATWVMLKDPQTGEAKPVYIEQEILISPFPLH